MRKIKSILKFAAVFVLTLCCCVFTACVKEQSPKPPKDFEGLIYGIYYSSGAEDSFIAIKSDGMSVLHNLDFSDFNPEDYWMISDGEAERPSLQRSGKTLFTECNRPNAGCEGVAVFGRKETTLYTCIRL